MAKAKKSNRLLVMVMIGISFGCLWLISPGCLFLISLVAFVAVMLWRFSKAEDRKFIMSIFIIGMTSRIIIYLILGFISILAGKSGWIVGDSWGIFNYAWAWAQQVDGIPNIIYMESIDGHIYTNPASPITVWQYGYSGMTYLLGTIYYFFGPLKFSPRLLNCLMGVGTGILIYYLVKDIFGNGLAKLSAIFTLFMPSLFLWSITFLKDTPFTFFSCIVLWSFVRFQKTKRAQYLLILLLGILIQYTVRPMLGLKLIVLTLFLSYFIVSGISWKKKIVVLICLLMLAVPFLHRINLKTIKTKVNNQMARSLRYSQGILTSGGSTYKIFDDKYYRGGSMFQLNLIDFSKGFFKAWFYFLSMPFPWKIYTKMLLISYIQVILWYCLIPFVFIGMATALRYKWRETFVIFAYILIIGSSIAMFSGNIGTVFRHRDMLTPLFLIFGSLGVMKTLGRLEIK